MTGQGNSPLQDLVDESAELDAVVTGLAAADWSLATPAAGWTIAAQIGHLTWTDERALWATNDAFAAARAEVAANPDGYVDAGAAAEAARGPEALLLRWRSSRDRLADALAQVPRGGKLPWYGPPMSALSMATARLMETFAHGQDIRDTLGRPPPDTPRLRNIAYLCVRTRDFAYRLRDLVPPDGTFSVDLTGPGGVRWHFGDDESDQRVTGPALDFCLLATQRRHLSDLDVAATGADAEHWLTIIQAFAGAPGRGRGPRAS